MNVLGIDMGFGKVGFAVGSTELKMAFPRMVVPFESYLLEMGRLIEDENIEKIVLGDPNGLSKNDTHRQAILAEKEAIEDFSEMVVELADERFTSRIAEQSLFALGHHSREVKKNSDAAAAALILQGWFDKLTINK